MVDRLTELLNRMVFIVGKLVVDRIFGGTGSIARNGRFKLLMERFNKMVKNERLTKLFDRTIDGTVESKGMVGSSY